MFLIEKLWIDSLENNISAAYGYTPIGAVSSKEEADRICNLEHVEKIKYPWPLGHLTEFPGETVPRFIAKEIKNLDNISLEELRKLN